MKGQDQEEVRIMDGSCAFIERYALVWTLKDTLRLSGHGNLIPVFELSYAYPYSYQLT
jgi:hypothetical protein